MKAKLIFTILFLLLIPSASRAAAPSKEVLATVGGKSITEQDVESEAKRPLDEMRRQIAEIKRAALTQVINRKLIELGAQAEKIPVGEFEKRLNTPGRTIEEKDIQAYYDANQANIRRPLAEVREQVRGLLAREEQMKGRSARLRELRAKYPVKILMQPERRRVDIPKDAIAKGPADAPVTIIFFSDFECPFCARGNETLTRVLQNYPGKIRLVYRDYSMRFHPHARKAAEAARCAHEQGQFWPYYETLFRNNRNLTDADLQKYAAGLALDLNAFNACLGSGRHRKQVDEENRYAESVGVSGTPAFFINGRVLAGAYPYERFEEIVEEELSGAGG